MGLREVYEIVELGVAEVELVHCRDAVVRLDEFEGIAVDDAVKHERIYQAAVVRGGKFDVRGDSASVANDAAFSCLEFVGERVRDLPDAAVLVAVAVVDGLNTAARRGVVLRRGHFQLTVVGDRADGLHESLSETATSHHRGAVKVLEGSSDNLRR